MLSHKCISALCSTLCISASCLASQPDIASGDLLEPDQLEAKGIYMFDGLMAAAQLYGLKDMSHVTGSAENLLNLKVDWIAGAGPFRSTRKNELNVKRTACSQKHETFARSDCAKEVLADFVTYGKFANDAKFIRLAYGGGLVSWDEQRETLVLRNGHVETYGPDGTCIANAICTPVGSFAPRNYKYVVCLHLPANFTNHIQAGHLPESQARALSVQYGDIRRLKMSLVAELTRPMKALVEPQQCPLTGNKLWAEGWITPRAITFGDAGHGSYVATSLKYLAR